MGGFRLLSRVAFICNICFVLAIILQRTKSLGGGEIVSLIIIMGYVLAVIMNAVVGIWYLFLHRSYKTLSNVVPLWLIIVNYLFLILQLILFLK